MDRFDLDGDSLVRELVHIAIERKAVAAFLRWDKADLGRGLVFVVPPAIEGGQYRFFLARPGRMLEEGLPCGEGELERWISLVYDYARGEAFGSAGNVLLAVLGGVSTPFSLPWTAFDPRCKGSVDEANRMIGSGGAESVSLSLAERYPEWF